MLHPINRGPRDNKYCGPAVVSFLTGHNTSDIARVIRARSRGRILRVKGTHNHQINSALRYISGHRLLSRGHVDGVELGDIPEGERPTLAQWLAETKHLRGTRTFLLAAGNHWQLIEGKNYACGVVGEVVPITDKRIRKRCRVEEVHAVC